MDCVTGQRSFTRVHAHIAAELALPGGQVLACALEDVSLGGVLLSTESEVPAATTCSVALILSGVYPAICIFAKGIVVRSGAGKVAVDFSEVDEESYPHLRRLVLMNARDPGRVEDELEASVGIKRQPDDF